jgi:hypothetical protein
VSQISLADAAYTAQRKQTADEVFLATTGARHHEGGGNAAQERKGSLLSAREHLGPHHSCALRTSSIRVHQLLRF